MKRFALALAGMTMAMGGTAIAQDMNHSANTAIQDTKITDMSYFDRDRDMMLSPMEFAQVMVAMNPTIGASGGPELPSMDKYMHKGTAHRMQPGEAVELLNATAHAFTIVDSNNDWRISQAELRNANLL